MIRAQYQRMALYASTWIQQFDFPLRTVPWDFWLIGKTTAEASGPVVYIRTRCRTLGVTAAGGTSHFYAERSCPTTTRSAGDAKFAMGDVT